MTSSAESVVTGAGRTTFPATSLDELLPEEHEARIVWAYVCSCDLSELYERIQAVEGGPGQAPADPRTSCPCGWMAP